MKYELSSTQQKVIQLVLVWLLPIIGSIVLIIYTRAPDEGSFTRLEIVDPKGDSHGSSVIHPDSAD